MTATIIRGDARNLPLPDACVDLVVTSPPYFGLRSYTDNGEHYAGQIGSESTPAEWLAAMLECTREWCRVLKPEGSLFVNLGDKYNSAASGQKGTMSRGGIKWPVDPQGRRYPMVDGAREKSLLGLPWRYALACTDQLGLILRRDIIWSKPNGLPESVTDRCRSSHEYVFHLVKQPRYYSAVDEIREPHNPATHARGRNGAMARDGVTMPTWGINGTQSLRGVEKRYVEPDPLGKLPGSVWNIPSQPFIPPKHAGEHFAAFPMELPRRCILGWSPPGVCTGCGQGRRPVVDKTIIPTGRIGGSLSSRRRELGDEGAHGYGSPDYVYGLTRAIIRGYTCACAPLGDFPCCDPGKLPPTRPAVVLDPFGGTGTTALVASALGRNAIGIDLSADYCRLAQWRLNDPGQRAAAMQVPKPPPVSDDQMELFA